ncbi:hypothetical protein LCGC14_2420680, partial [marine sediment metagenome]
RGGDLEEGFNPMIMLLKLDCGAEPYVR